MQVGSIRFPAMDSSNGIGVEVYFAGCWREPKCKGCHNPELWDMEAGTRYSPRALAETIDLIGDGVKQTLVLLGGEPLHQPELPEFLALARTAVDCIWLYTSYELEQVPESVRCLVDFIKTGSYMEDLRVEDKWLASENQKVWRKTEDGQWRTFYSTDHGYVY